MNGFGGPGNYYYDGSPRPLGDKPRSSWVWPTLMGVAAVIAAGLVLLIALQLTDGDDEAAPTPTAATSSTAAAATSVAVASDATQAGSTPTSAAAEGSVTTQPATTAEQGDGDDQSTDRSCASYTVDESLPVQRCSRGALVEEIQSALTEAGLALEVDGLFGPKTEDAVLEFQASNGLEQDGIVGPATYDALPSVLTEPDG
jgi:peptidoglycan hydrolase-like protein with peptidoglycan-binding domain